VAPGRQAACHRAAEVLSGVKPPAPSAPLTAEP
jgi:hypothetical protein